MPDLDPQREARLRRLLAEARHEEPIPVDVAARLDHVLARLADEPLAEPSAPVIDITARRRRRVAALLAAAAAVVVGGVGIGRLVGVQHDDEPARDAAVAPAHKQESDSALEQQSDAAPNSPASSLAPVAPEALDEGAAPPQGLRATPGIPHVSAKGFSADVARVRKRLPRLATTEPFAGTAAMCEPADWGAGTLVAVRFKGGPAVLVFRPATGTTQIADLLQCGSGEVLRSTSLPTR